MLHFIIKPTVSISELFQLVVAFLKSLLLTLDLNITLLLATKKLIKLNLMSLLHLYLVNAELCDLLLLGHD